jgi:hypothetical protein
MRLIAVQTEAKLQHATLAIGERLQAPRERVEAKHVVERHGARRLRPRSTPRTRSILVTDRHLQRNGDPRDPSSSGERARHGL